MHTRDEFPDRILSRLDTARMLCVSERTLDRINDLPKLKLSASRVGYRQSAVLDWIEPRHVLGEAV